MIAPGVTTRLGGYPIGTASTAPELLTVGHGTASREALAGLVRGAGGELVVDIRRFPGSRRHPDMARDALAQWLPAAGVDHRWEPRLGGRRTQAGKLVHGSYPYS